MQIIEFSIKGNQENAEGNPIPYFRQTQNTKWTDGARRYEEWKNYVVSSMLAHCGTPDMLRNDLNYNRPLEIPNGGEARMAIEIWWASRAHGDGDNIFKGIADALFINDKEVVEGSFKSQMSTDKKGRVEVRILINNKSNIKEVAPKKAK
jgi:Holliday junction resolvase RusA-like endonuclease